jgi:hypothetical protein
LIYDIATEHTEITFIEKIHLQVSISGCCNIVSRYRIHDNFHGSAGSCFYQHVDAEIHRRSVVLFSLTHIRVVVKIGFHIIVNALGGFVYKSDKLIARCFRGYSGYISEAGIVACGQ